MGYSVDSQEVSHAHAIPFRTERHLVQPLLLLGTGKQRGFLLFALKLFKAEHGMPVQMQQKSESMASIDSDQVIRQHMGIVYQAVDRLGGSMAKATGAYDDLVSAGMIGLLSAIEAYDSTRGAAFTTYAYPRVRGAVLDELRRLDFVPRSVRRKKRAVSRARIAVQARDGRASDESVATELGVDLPTFWRWSLDAESASPEAMDASEMRDLMATQAAEAWVAGGIAPDAAIEQAEEVERVRDAIAKLPEQERLVLILCFYEDLKLRQVGELVGVSESRVSQIRSRAIARLRESLTESAA